mmetsp:Transcript_6667/g.20934  ORF Transcript_6667/g.20934 Transcript_6667/m.20934 type:complete len:212 (+) Transcript_6667:1208-1843(+)
MTSCRDIGKCSIWMKRTRTGSIASAAVVTSEMKRTAAGPPPPPGAPLVGATVDSRRKGTSAPLARVTSRSVAVSADAGGRFGAGVASSGLDSESAPPGVVGGIVSLHGGGPALAGGVGDPVAGRRGCSGDFSAARATELQSLTFADMSPGVLNALALMPAELASDMSSPPQVVSSSATSAPSGSDDCTKERAMRSRRSSAAAGTSSSQQWK